MENTQKTAEELFLEHFYMLGERDLQIEEAISEITDEFTPKLRALMGEYRDALQREREAKILEGTPPNQISKRNC